MEECVTCTDGGKIALGSRGTGSYSMHMARGVEGREQIYYDGTSKL